MEFFRKLGTTTVTLSRLSMDRSEEWEKDCALVVAEHQVDVCKNTTTPTNNFLYTNNLDTKRCLVYVQYVDMFTRLRSIKYAVHNKCQWLLLILEDKRIEI